MVRIRYPFGLYFLGRPSAVWEPRNHLGSGEQAGEKTLLRVISLISFFVAQLLVRDLEDAVVHALRKKAAEEGTSVV
jgi:hypothetical protein